MRESKKGMGTSYALVPLQAKPNTFLRTVLCCTLAFCLLYGVACSLLVLLANWTLVHGFYYYASEHVYLVCLMAPVGSIALLLAWQYRTPEQRQTAILTPWYPLAKKKACIFAWMVTIVCLGSGVVPVLYFQRAGYPSDNYDRCMPTCPDSECHHMRTRFERKPWEHSRLHPSPFSLVQTDQFWEQQVWGTPKAYQMQLAPGALDGFAQWMATAATGDSYGLELEYLVPTSNGPMVAMMQHMEYTIGTQGSQSLVVNFIALKHFLPRLIKPGAPCVHVADGLLVGESGARALETFLRNHGHPKADIGVKAQTTHAVKLFLEQWAQLATGRNISRVIAFGGSQWCHNVIQLAHQSTLVTHAFMNGPSAVTVALEAVKNECAETVEALVLPGRHDNFFMTQIQQSHPRTWPYDVDSLLVSVLHKQVRIFVHIHDKELWQNPLGTVASVMAAKQRVPSWMADRLSLVVTPASVFDFWQHGHFNVKCSTVEPFLKAHWHTNVTSFDRYEDTLTFSQRQLLIEWLDYL